MRLDTFKEKIDLIEDYLLDKSVKKGDGICCSIWRTMGHGIVAENISQTFREVFNPD